MMKLADKTIHRRGLHVMFLLPGLLSLMLLGLGGVLFQIASTMAVDYPSDSATYVALEHIALYSLVISIIMALLGALLGLILSRALVRSIRDLVNTAQSNLIGSLSSQTQPPKKSEGFVEVDQIGQTFNQMMRDIYMTFRQRDSALMQGAAFGLVTTDKYGHIMAANARAEDYLGVGSAELIGKNFVSLCQGRAELDFVRQLVTNVIENGKLSVEETVELSGHDGRRRRFLVSASMILDHFSRSNGCVVMLRPSQRYSDFDKRMREIDRLAMLGTFTVGLVHEIRNPIAAVKGLSKLLVQLPPDSPKAREFAEEIQSESSRLERLMSELHQLANKSPNELRMPCDINKLISSSLSSVRHSSNKPDIHVDEQYGDLPNVIGFPDRLVQAFSNIIKNAMDASPPGGTVTIKTRRQFSTEENLELVQVLFTNSGETISDADRGKIFEPFYTTKQGGSGLGLPIATQVIVQHDGTITLHNSENFTTFEIILPGAAGETATAGNQS